MSWWIKYQALRWMLSGVLISAIAISQAIYGWVGDGVYYRVIYPLLLLAASTLPFRVSVMLWTLSEKPSIDDEPPPAEIPSEDSDDS